MSIWPDVRYVAIMAMVTAVAVVVMVCIGSCSHNPIKSPHHRVPTSEEL